MPLGLTLNFYSISLGKLIIANINKAFLQLVCAFFLMSCWVILMYHTSFESKINTSDLKMS